MHSVLFTSVVSALLISSTKPVDGIVGGMFDGTHRLRESPGHQRAPALGVMFLDILHSRPVASRPSPRHLEVVRQFTVILTIEHLVLLPCSMLLGQAVLLDDEGPAPLGQASRRRRLPLIGLRKIQGGPPPPPLGMPRPPAAALRPAHVPESKSVLKL
eukprot:143258-Prorocentrum_minimum.AAC.2